MFFSFLSCRGEQISYKIAISLRKCFKSNVKKKASLSGNSAKKCSSFSLTGIRIKFTSLWTFMEHYFRFDFRHKSSNFFRITKAIANSFGTTKCTYYRFQYMTEFTAFFKLYFVSGLFFKKNCFQVACMYFSSVILSFLSNVCKIVRLK